MNYKIREIGSREYAQTSLSVQKENYATKLYQKVGYKIVDENEEEYIMIYDFNQIDI